MPEPKWTHIDAEGNARMVDVGDKAVTKREAIAEGFIGMSHACFDMIIKGQHKKGDVLSVAQVAGIMGAKRNSELIPLCHLISLSHVSLTFFPGERPGAAKEELSYIRARCTVRCEGKTGVEMEALTGVSIALLTVYDMCKAVDRSMELAQICLVQKSGGKSGVYVRTAE